MYNVRKLLIVKQIQMTMKKINYLASLLAAVFVLSSCAGLTKMQKEASNIKYDVTPKVLETHAGQVEFTVTGVFPAKYFNKKAVVVGTPVLVYEKGETPFKPITMQGESIKANDKVINYVEGGKFTYSDKTAFSDDMRVSQLMLRVKATLGKKSVDFTPVKLADGVIATSTLVCKKGTPVLIGDKFVRIVPESKAADINFVINQADVRTSELKMEDILAFEQYLNDVGAATNKQLKGFELNAYASPDGPLDLNTKLADKRKVSADKYLEKSVKTAKIQNVDKATQYKEQSTAEDWDGFKSLMESSSMKDKDLILRVLSMYSDPVVREKEIKNMSEAYEILKTDVLPKLRRSVMQINIDKVGYSDAEILSLIDADPAKLNLEEILYAAKLTQDPAKKVKIYAYGSERFPTCFRTFNGQGVYDVELGKLDDAEAAFLQSQKLMDNDIIKSNLGIVALMKGDVEKAEGFFTSVQQPTTESKLGMGAISIIKGKYDDAKNYLKDQPSFNLALVTLVTGDAQGAKNILAKVEGECAMIPYLKAVCGARLGEDDFVFNNLRAAIEKKADLKGLAKTDMEFAKYFANDTFKSIVQ